MRLIKLFIKYANFLREDLPGLVEDVPLDVRRNMWFQQDGAPPHNSILARQVLRTVYSHEWIGCGSTVSWLPRSSNLLWTFFLIYLKTTCREPVDTLEELEETDYTKPMLQ